MANYSIAWDNDDKTVILVTYQPHWTWGDFYDSNMQTVALMKSVAHEVHVIADFRPAAAVPLGGAITHAHSAIKTFPPNWGLLVIVTSNMLVTRLVTIFRRTFPYDMGEKTFSVGTIEEAYKLFAQRSAHMREQA